MAEFWDVYDKDRNKLGKLAQRGVDKLDEGEYHIVVEVITITKEGMYPEFILDGVEYSAMRISGRWHTVHCQMIHPELAEPENVTGKRKVILQLIARLIPLIFIIFLPQEFHTQKEQTFTQFIIFFRKRKELS